MALTPEKHLSSDCAGAERCRVSLLLVRVYDCNQKMSGVKKGSIGSRSLVGWRIVWR